MRIITTQQLAKNSAPQKLSRDRTRSTLTPVEMRSNNISTLSPKMPLLQSQCACGGGCPRCQNSLKIQTKLKISEPGDVYEQETDQVADEVMRMPEPTIQLELDSPIIQTKSEGGRIISNILSNQIISLQGDGGSMNSNTKSFMESRFGQDFSRVRIHTDSKAVQLNQELNAQAFTVGNNVFFNLGKYLPESDSGKHLLAHELVHVLQQDCNDVIHRKPMAQNIKAKKRDVWLKKLAKQPGDAHRNWKHLTSMEKMALVIQMTNHYGYDFGKSFLWYTNHPINVVDQHFIPAFSEHTPEWFQSQGYKLWQRSSVNEFWVHPSGKEIMLVLETSKKSQTSKISQLPVPITEDSAELVNMSLSIVTGQISLETSVMKDLEDQKRQLEQMDVTTEDYRRRYDKYIQEMEEMKIRLKDGLNDMELLREQLDEMKSPDVFVVTDKIKELEDFQIWVDFESSSVSTQFIQPISLEFKDDDTTEDEIEE
jgi:Domain of unknown function (DUF4157)